MNWINTNSNCNYIFSTETNNCMTVTDTDTITLDLPDPLIEWLPYKWKKYLPTWHLVRSYQ